MKKFPFGPTLGAAVALLAFSPAASAYNDPDCERTVNIAFSTCISQSWDLSDEEFEELKAFCEGVQSREMEGCWREDPELHCGWSWSGPTCWYC